MEAKTAITSFSMDFLYTKNVSSVGAAITSFFDGIDMYIQNVFSNMLDCSPKKTSDFTGSTSLTLIDAWENCILQSHTHYRS